MKEKTIATQESSACPEKTVGDKEYVVRAKCLIDIGDSCTVYFPSHHDHESYVFHRNAHDQSAKVVKLHNGAISIEITSGPWEGRVIEVNPLVLFFWGPFISIEKSGG